MIATLSRRQFHAALAFCVADTRYVVKLAESEAEVESALRLRFDVFKRELTGEVPGPDSSRLEFDSIDFRCDHLIVLERGTSTVVGTYRLNTFEKAGGIRGFYSFNEFDIESLPAKIIRQGVEIGRACVARAHRNTKVLFLLWKGLAAYSRLVRKRYFFGCCSVFSTDVGLAQGAYRKLVADGGVHDLIRIEPKVGGVDVAQDISDDPVQDVEIPGLFQMYLKMGAKVCGPPMIDRDFGSTDFFVVLDANRMEPRYRAAFFGDA